MDGRLEIGHSQLQGKQRVSDDVSEEAVSKNPALNSKLKLNVS